MMTPNLFSLDGKVALITGASSGLGAHFAKTLAAAGARVVLAARRLEKLEKLQQEISKQGGQAMAVALDVTSRESIPEAFNLVEKQWGPVNVLINNAGIANIGPFLDLSEESWDQIMDTNLKGAWMVARECAARLVTAKSAGSIVNIASILGLRVGHSYSQYAITKAGVVQLTKSMALELARQNIRVNALAPGFFKTEMTEELLQSSEMIAHLKQLPFGRVGEYQELEGPLLLLASDASSFMSGAIIPVDGAHLVQSL